MSATGWKSKPAKFHSLEELLAACVASPEEWRKSLRFQSRDREIRYWTIEWSRHVEKHGNVPLVLSHLPVDVSKRDTPRGEWRLPRKREEDDGPPEAA